jgi:hypothetical protein
MQKPTFRNFHKQKYTLLSKNMQRKNTVDNNPITLRNLGKCQGKPQCGETQRERERDLLLCFRKVQNNNKSTFPAKENTSQHQICPTEICLVFHAKTVLLYDLLLPRFPCPQSVVRTVPYGPKTTNRKHKSASKSMPEMPRFSCQIRTTVLYGLYPYSTASHSRKIFRPKIHRKSFSRESCPLSLENVPSLLLTFLSQACSENLSNSPPDVLSTSSRCLHNMSCTLPNAFFYNLKMTFSPQKCLFTFPTLDPKAKIRSCLFQDQGS